MSKAVVILSGGQDSTTSLLWAMEKFNHVETITFDYGQRNRAEIRKAEQIAKDFGVNNKIIPLDLLNELTVNALTRRDIIITDDGIPNTFVPGRNQLFITIASIYANSIKARNIVTGVSQTESSGYPDCSDDFIKALNLTLNIGTGYQYEIHTPLMWKDKSQVWEMADKYGKLEYIRENTITCYKGISGEGCKECPACKLRNNGLEEYLKRRGY